MTSLFFPPPATDDFSDAWLEGDSGARWRSVSRHGSGSGASASGSSQLEVDPGHRLPRHTDSAEETIVVIAGRARVCVGDDVATLPAGGIAVVPAGVPHEVQNAGDETLRFLAVYAASEVTTTYEAAVQPAGERERSAAA